MKELRGMKIHIIGIGGTGMAPIAVVLHEMGAVVSGSDRSESIFTEDLRSRGVQVMIPQSADNITDPDMVFYSSAIHDDNPELEEARKREIPTLKRREFLGFMLEGRKTIAIAGSHGKSTTTSMMTWVLSALGKEPGFIVGSNMKDLGRNAAAGKSGWFVIEADEYDNMFLGLKPFTAALTRVEYDHPDCFPTPEIYMDAFQKFLNNTQNDGFALINGDDPNQSTLSIPDGRRVFHYGFGSDCDYQAVDLSIGSNGCYTYRFIGDGQSIPVMLKVPGIHNVSNSLLVLSFCAVNGFDLEKAAEALGSFHGIGRRFELVGEWNGIKFIDDYAHHPTEIRATLRAAREYFPNHRIWAVWQPHTFSRTKALLSDFCASFDDADEVIVTDIYASRESYTGFGVEQVMEAMEHSSVRHLSGNDAIAGFFADHLQKNEVVVILSAGDANQIAPLTLEKLQHANH